VSGYRATARAVGALFIIATVAAILGGSLLLPLADATELAPLAGDKGQMISGALIELVLVLAVVGIAVLLFPVLRRHGEGAALAYVGVRTIEAVVLLVAALTGLVAAAVSETAAAAGSGPIADLVLAVRDTTYLVGSTAMLGVGGLILYTLLYRSRLVPRWLSLWGLLGAALILGRGLLEVYGVELSGVVQGITAAPIGLQEMVLAAWLIVKGFNPSALAVEPSGTTADDALRARRLATSTR
jgi:hypothetical protein